MNYFVLLNGKYFLFVDENTMVLLASYLDIKIDFSKNNESNKPTLTNFVADD